MIEDFLLVTLALALELLEPALRDVLGNCINHPLRNVAHYVEAVHEEDFRHFMAKLFVKSWLEDKTDDDEVCAHALRLLWHHIIIVR